MRKKAGLAGKPSLLRLWRPYVLPALALTLAGLVVTVALHRWERFLLNDGRFQLRTPGLGERISPDVQIGGIDQTRPAEVAAVFRQDEGHSVYGVPLAERRERLLRLKWVREASVSRIWPRRLDVRLVERRPVAYVQIKAARKGIVLRTELIDSDGETMPLGDGRKYQLPVLTGIQENLSRAERARRVRIMRRLLAEAGESGKRLSEIDVSEPDNLQVIYPVEDRALTLVLGGERWRARLRKFELNYAEILRKKPDTVKLDLRFERRIVALSRDGEDRVE